MRSFSNHGANVKQFANKYGLNEQEIVDFSSNINIFTPDINYEIIISNIKKSINKYPDIDYVNLKSYISKIYDIDKDYIYLGNGATQVIYDLLMIEKFQNIAIFNPTFSEYERACIIYKKNVIDLDINSICKIKQDMSVSEFRKTVFLDKKELSNIDLIILCNPNNPSGKIEDINNLLEFCKKNNIFILVDETFIDFLDNDKLSLKTKVKYYDNTIVLNAITKFFAMTGARLGYCFCSNKDINNYLQKNKKPWSINILAQEIASQLVNLDKKFYKDTKNYFKEESKRLYTKYSNIDCIKTYKTSTCFFMIEFDENIDVKDLQVEILKKHNILVRVLDNYKNINNNSIRIAIKEKQQNDKIYKIIKSYIDKKNKYQYNLH